jgi:hypothetical protein
MQRPSISSQNKSLSKFKDSQSSFKEKPIKAKNPSVIAIEQVQDPRSGESIKQSLSAIGGVGNTQGLKSDITKSQFPASNFDPIDSLLSKENTCDLADPASLYSSSPQEANVAYLNIAQDARIDTPMRLKAYLSISDKKNISLSDIAPHLKELPLVKSIVSTISAKDILAASELTYIHEPYWRYSPDQLHEYGRRIIQKISTCFVDPVAIQKDSVRKSYSVLHKGKPVTVRRVTEFGRVLPLMYLQEVLSHQKSAHLAVPKLFIMRDPSKPISFTFHMPHLKEGYSRMAIDCSNNILQIDSDSFEIYQEYIEGSGTVGDKSFSPYGHCDFNAKQVFESAIDGKKYLIDTKESKNFFSPATNPIAGSIFSYWHVKSGRHLPQDEASFSSWQLKQQAIMLIEKGFNYPIDQASIQIDMGALDALDLDTLSPRETVCFDDDAEDSLYFPNPKDNVARYLGLKRFDLLKHLVQTHPSLSLDAVSVPSLIDSSNLKALNPVQFLLQNTASAEELLELLALFKNQKEYFANSEKNYDIALWPLNMALQWRNPELITFMLAAGVNPNENIHSKSILDCALDALSSAIVSKSIENQKSLMTIIEHLLASVDQTKPSTLIRFLQLIPAQSRESTHDFFTFTKGKILLEALLKKAREPSPELIIAAANHGTLELLNLVLEYCSDQSILKEAFIRLLAENNEVAFKTLPEDLKQSLLRTLLEKINYVDQNILGISFQLELKSILSEIMHKAFDTGFALYSAVKKIKDPAHDYIRVHLKNPPRDPYWNELVKAILAKNPPAEALDKSMTHALANSKVDILEDLLKNKPTEAPYMQAHLSDIKDSLYEGPLILERAILKGHIFLTHLLISADLKVESNHFSKALNLIKNQKDILSILVHSNSIDLHRAITLSINSECVEAIKIVLSCLETIDSDTYAKAFKTKNPAVIDAILSRISPNSQNTVLMTLHNVEETCRLGDISAITLMVDRNVNLGESLLAITKLITYAKDRKLEIKEEWYSLMDKILSKNPPEKDLDHAIAIALNNSKTVILKKLMTRMPQEAPQTKEVVQLQVQSKYMKDEYFKRAISLNNKILIKLFIDCGMPIKPDHKKVAAICNYKESLAAMEEQHPS